MLEKKHMRRVTKGYHVLHVFSQSNSVWRYGDKLDRKFAKAGVIKKVRRVQYQMQGTNTPYREIIRSEIPTNATFHNSEGIRSACASEFSVVRIYVNSAQNGHPIQGSKRSKNIDAHRFLFEKSGEIGIQIETPLREFQKSLNAINSFMLCLPTFAL